MLVEVAALDLRRYPAIALVGIVRNGEKRSIPYLRAICGERRDPRKGERLVVYLRGGAALGWASPEEAKAF